MIPPQRGGSITEAIAEHLRFDILEEKKLEKIDKKKKSGSKKSVREYVELLSDYSSQVLILPYVLNPSRD